MSTHKQNVSLEEAARKALAALESAQGNINPERGFADEVEGDIAEAITEMESLRAALAEQQNAEQPALPEPDIDGTVMHQELKICYMAPVHYSKKLMQNYAGACVAADRAARGDGEPIGELEVRAGTDILTTYKPMSEGRYRIYTHPPQRKTLTDKQIDAVTNAYWGAQVVGSMYAAYRGYARAVIAELTKEQT